MCIIDCRRPSFFVSRGKFNSSSLSSRQSSVPPSIPRPRPRPATRPFAICHLPFACCFRGALRINHAQYLVFPQSTVHALTVAARSTARRCTFAQTVRKDASIALLTLPHPNQSTRRCTVPLGHLDWTALDGPTWTIPSHRAPGHHHASAPAVPLPAVARRTLAILSSLRPSRPRSTRSRPGLPPLNTIRTACVPTRCRLPQLATLHSTSSSSTLSAPTRSPSRMG